MHKRIGAQTRRSPVYGLRVAANDRSVAFGTPERRGGSQIQARQLRIGIPDMALTESQERALIDLLSYAGQLTNPVSVQYYIVP